MNEIKEQIRKNPKGFACPHCKFDFEKRFGIVGSNDLQKGQIWVCANCANVSVLGDVDLHPLTKEEFEAFPKPKQVALASTVTKIKQRIDAGSSWNPYELPNNGN